jgi:signal peptidase I
MGLALAVAAVVAAVVIYLVNPFHTPSLDPRARVLGFMVFRVPSENMAPTIPRGKTIWIDVANLRNRDPRVGEIVVFRWPVDPSVHFVKRVIATGGSTFEMHNGLVSLEGHPLEEPYLPKTPLMPDTNDEVAPTRIPDGEFFVLGDNRGNSLDSRMWGNVPRALIIGVYRPPES